jgi:hypothetical protein
MQYKWIYLSLICRLFYKVWTWRSVCSQSDDQRESMLEMVCQTKKLGQDGDWMKFFYKFSVLQKFPKNHSVSLHHCWENTLLTFRISMWNHSSGICYKGYSEVKYMKSIKEGYLGIVRSWTKATEFSFSTEFI